MTSIEIDSENCRERFLGTIHRVFGSDDALLKCCAVRALERMKSCDGVSKKWLVDLLSDPDVDVRVDAVAALGPLRVGGAGQARRGRPMGRPYTLN